MDFATTVGARPVKLPFLDRRCPRRSSSSSQSLRSSLPIKMFVGPFPTRTSARSLPAYCPSPDWYFLRSALTELFLRLARISRNSVPFVLPLILRLRFPASTRRVVLAPATSTRQRLCPSRMLQQLPSRDAARTLLSSRARCLR